MINKLEENKSNYFYRHVSALRLRGKNYPLQAFDVFVRALTSKYLQSSEELCLKKKESKNNPQQTMMCYEEGSPRGGSEYLPGFTLLLRTEENIISTL